MCVQLVCRDIEIGVAGVKLWRSVCGREVCRNYVVMVDFFTDFFECEWLKESAVTAIKKTFAKYVIPDVFQSDNGPRFTASEFKVFSEAWGFHHTTSSPAYQQSSGKADQTVKILKWLYEKSKRSLPFYSRMQRHTYCLNDYPTERMFGRSTRSVLPTGLTNGNPTSDKILWA